MTPKRRYLLLCILGTVIPYVPFIRWLLEHGIDPQLFVSQLFANRISTFYGFDVFMSAVGVIAFAQTERDRAKLRRWWLPVIAVFTVGPSLGLPLLLLLREQHAGHDGQPLPL